MNQRTSDPLELITELLRPYVAPIVRRITADEFTTVDFVEAMQLDDNTRRAYIEALARWPENERRAKMVVHGQVIPTLLRETGLVEWAGFAHDVVDPYAVPAWWQRITEEDDSGS